MKKPKHTLTSIALIVGAVNNVQGSVEKTANLYGKDKTALIYTNAHRKSRDYAQGIKAYPIESIFEGITDVRNIHAGPIADFAMQHELEKVIICTEGISNLGFIESLSYKVTGKAWQPEQIHKHHPSGGHLYDLQNQEYKKN